jgi:hypothetical protein
MQAGTHRIRRQRWQVRVTSPAAAFALRLALRTQLDSVLLPAFARAFDALASGDEVVHIPQLTLKLQLRDGEDLIAALASLIEQQLSQNLAPAAAMEPARVPARRLAAKTSRHEMLLEYLATGRIAWYATTLSTAEVLPLLRDAAHLLAADADQSLRALGGSLDARTPASFRLLQLLDPAPRAALLQRVRGAGAPIVPPLLAAMHRLVAVQQLDTYMEMRLAALLLALRAEDLHLPLPAAVGALLCECAAGLARAGIGDIDFAAALPVPTTPATPHHCTGLATRAAPAARADKPHATGVDLGGTVASANNSPAAVAESQATGTKADDDPAAAHGCFVNNAGLILLHPFLPRFLNVVGIAAEGARALDTAHLPRAAALLHWLATGRDEVFEFELPLVKVLLGIARDVPLPVACGLLNNDDRTEANALLAAAVEHWPALRHTSVAGLRGTFLQRRGLLRDDGSGWRLQVEAESFDVLLGRLPWSINLVKLPWMTKPIFTDWPTP